MSADSSRPPSLMMPSEEPELELDDLKPLRAPDRERDLSSQEEQGLMGEAELGFEPASVPSAPPQALSPEQEPALEGELEGELEAEAGSPSAFGEASAEPSELRGDQPPADQLKPPRVRRVAPQKDEPYEAPQAPLFPPRGAWGPQGERPRGRPRLVKGPVQKLGASTQKPLLVESDEGTRSALAPRAHPSAALLDPEVKGKRRRPSADELSQAPERSAAHVSPEQLDGDAAAALVALERELAQTLLQLEGREEGAASLSAPLKVATWSDEQTGLMAPQPLRAEMRVIDALPLPEIFMGAGAQGSPEALIGEGVGRALDLSGLPQAEARQELDQLLNPSPRAPQGTEAAPRAPAAARPAPSRPIKAGERVGDEGWVLDGLLNKIHGVQTWLARSPQGEGVIVKLAWPEELSENPMSWTFDAELRLKSLQTLSRGVAQRPLAWGDEPELGCWYAALEWVEGQSVAEMSKRSPLSEGQARDVFARLAEGLATLHHQGVIHRKIQPSHIILGPEGPRLISFQWVDEVEGEDIQRKQQGVYQALRARPVLLAPEWMEEGQITSAADVYALAASLLISLNPDAQGWTDGPRPLRIALAHAMHPDPELRSSARQLARDLRLSARRYLYRGGSDESQMVERLYLADIVDRVLSDELGWHAVMREGAVSEGEPPDLAPWGEVAEIREVVQRSKELKRAAQQHEMMRELTRRPQELSAELEVEGGLSAEQRHALQAELDELREALIIAERRLTSQEESLKKQREELDWRDEALRGLERDLQEREAGVEEERARLEVWREEIELQDQKIQERWEEAKAALKAADAERARVEELSGSLERERAELAEASQEVDERARELEAERATLEAELGQEKERLEELYRAAKEGLLEEEAAQLIERRAAEEEAQRLNEQAERLERERAFALQLQEEEAAEAARLAELDEYLAELQSDKAARARARAEEARPYRVSAQEPVKVSPSKPGDELVIELGESPLRMRYIPAGIGLIGALEGDGRADERPQHKVKLTRGYWLAETPISQRQWSELMMVNPSQFAGGSRPVEGVSWLEAISFCNSLSDLEGRSRAYMTEGAGARTRVLWDQAADGYRLPTEVEWEYAARCAKAGAQHLYAGGSDLDAVAWYGQNASGETHALGLKDPNAWGLKDLCGQVWEWCHDEWRADAYKERAGDLSYDPQLYSPLMSAKVVRGGAWYDFASACRLASRPGQDPETRYGMGLRVLRPA